MAELWFTSDTHFSHRNIISFCDRPYHSVGEMNQAMINNWNELVSPDDTVYHGGDVALGPAEALPQNISQLNGHKHLIIGNHDRPWPVFKAAACKRYIDAGFESLTMYAHIKLGPHVVMLSHMPYDVGVYDERFKQFHPQDRGLPLLHGHVHTEWQQRGRQINVGVDVWDMRPVHADTLIERINQM